MKINVTGKGKKYNVTQNLKYMWIGIGNTILRCGGGGAPTFIEKSYTVLDTLANARYNWYVTMDKIPGNSNKILMTWIDGAAHTATHDTQIKMRISTDKGRTFGSAVTIYHPVDTNEIIINHITGITSDGRFHILVVTYDGISGVYTLLYLYSDNDGTSFIITDVSALMNPAMDYIAVTGKLRENDGILIGGGYEGLNDNSSTAKLCFRLVTGVWSKVVMETTVAYENETYIQALDDTHLISLSRAEVTMDYVQMHSDDNGLTWTRDYATAFCGVTANVGSFGFLSSFMMNGVKIIEFTFPRRGLNGKLYTIYAKASDLLNDGVLGWNFSTFKEIWDCDPTVIGNTVQTGETLHYDNDYNAIAWWAQHLGMIDSNIYLFDVDTTNYNALRALLFPSYSADADSNAFNAVNNTNPTAIVNLVGGLKQHSLWTKLKAAYPMIGGTAALHKYNLINPADSDAAFRLVFVGGWTHSATGAKPNGTTGYAHTYLIPSVDLALYSCHAGIYSRTNIDDASVDIGAVKNGTGYPSVALYTRQVDNTGAFFAYSGSGGLVDWATGTANADSRGMTLGSRISNIINMIFYRGAQSGLTNITTALTSQPDVEIVLGADNFNGVIQEFSTRENAFTTIGAGLTVANVHNLTRIIHYFQKALSRQV